MLIPDDLLAATLEAEATVAKGRAADGTPLIDELRVAVMQNKYPWVEAALDLAGHEHLRVPIHKALDEIDRAKEEQALVLAELKGGAAHWALEVEACRRAIGVHRAAIEEAARAAECATAAPPAVANTAAERKAQWMARCALRRQQAAARAAAASVAWLERYISSTEQLQQAAVVTRARLAQRQNVGDSAPASDTSLDDALLAAAEGDYEEEEDEERSGWDEEEEEDE